MLPSGRPDSPSFATRSRRLQPRSEKSPAEPPRSRLVTKQARRRIQTTPDRKQEAPLKTEDLIDALADDLRPCSAVGLDCRLAMAAGGAGLAAMIGVIAWLKMRPDLADAVTGAIFWSKAAYTMALAACGFWILTRLGRPGASVRAPTLLLAGVLSIAAAAAATELLGAAPQDRTGLLMGGSASVCPAYILALAGMAAPFAFWGARQFAPTRPRAAGAAAGLMAAGVAATLYGLHCQERTASFVVVWYSLGIGLATLLGGLLGGRLLRW